MRVALILLALLISNVVNAAGEEFKGSCAYGLSEYQVDVKTDCSIRWANPSTGKIYCFGNEEVLGKFLKDPTSNIRKADQIYARYSK
jgi:YHS domain-containing protein